MNPPVPCGGNPSPPPMGRTTIKPSSVRLVMSSHHGPIFRCLTGFTLIALLLVPACGSGESATPPNLMLITVDTLRADVLGCYGFPADTSPAIDALAAEGIRFERVYAQASSTCPSLASLMTSRMPGELGVRHNRNRFRKGPPTLAERLKARGYATAAVVSNFVLRKGTGFERGFDRYDDTMDRAEGNRNLKERLADATTDAALDLLRGKLEEPFFLWVHFQDPHGPYTPPSGLDRRFEGKGPWPGGEIPLNDDNSGVGGLPLYQRLPGVDDRAAYAARYLGEVRHLDDEVGRLLDEIKATGLDERLVVALTADHGESLGEHDHFFAHGEYLYEDQVRVPLVMRLPAAYRDAARRARPEEPAALWDLSPTLLELAGAKPDAASSRGRSLIAAKSGRTGPIPTQTFRAKYITRDRKALVFGDYKFIRSENGIEELYLLTEDPGEKKNLRDRERNRGDALGKLLDHVFAPFEQGAGSAEAPPLDPETKKHLDSIGY